MVLRSSCVLNLAFTKPLKAMATNTFPPTPNEPKLVLDFASRAVAEYPCEVGHLKPHRNVEPLRKPQAPWKTIKNRNNVNTLVLVIDECMLKALFGKTTHFSN